MDMQAQLLRRNAIYSIYPVLIPQSNGKDKTGRSFAEKQQPVAR